MTAGEETTPRPDDDPSTASDALSLHTIAEADAYATQEQEDADFALALALEEQESQRYARTQSILRGHDPNRVTAPVAEPTETLPPYYDNPEANVADEEQDGSLPPYRDDPDAAPVEGQTEEETAEPIKRQRAFLRVLRKLFKAWACCLMISTIFTIIVIVVVFVLVLVYGTKSDPKKAAWEASKSQDYQLKLPKLYPDLEAGTTEGCKNAWRTVEEAQSLPCHRMILSSAWDNGDAHEANAAGADPYYYSDAICTATCQGALNRMARPLAKSCTVRTDRFDFANYGKDGKAYFAKGPGRIEESPVHVAKNLLERYERFCHRPTKRSDRSEWGTCAADLWMEWGIVDGKKEAHMNGMDQFLKQTSVRKTTPAARRTVSYWKSPGVNATRTVKVRSREFGPGVAETDCSRCTLEWFERKMRSFEFGQMLDPATGKPLGLTEFREKLQSAIRRCRVTNGALPRVDAKWTELGWWCDGKPCNVDKPYFSPVTLAVLHGWSQEEKQFRGVRELIAKKEAPKDVLHGMQVFLDGVKDMPCGIAFSRLIAKDQIIPYSHIVARLCSDECRNALDRFNAQHGALFARLSKDPKWGNMFQYTSKAAEIVDQVCLSTIPNAILQSPENLCAPGYAAVGYAEWIFAETEDYDPRIIHRSVILDAFSREIDALAARLPARVPAPKTDPESARIQSKKLAESACNTCAGAIFIGKEPNWKKTVDEYHDDPNINGTAYVAAAKKGWLTCGKMYGMEFNEWQKRRMWKRYGLDWND
ncbi:hypothetical protein BU23DRAFT_604387 [Bimuria novae-zelandiae CBS 107.79]|uniref:Uncharacterized protein n=1 Tax=Bimuria novae-zelandiae CBS 107.79 TaxID=1447943 RepID=A0A6A5UVW5_9PLEO|nr:hypothetical protein BU23DRAFT_604387 [Bimuria novae-zelandiae CBS 107.79]